MKITFIGLLFLILSTFSYPQYKIKPSSFGNGGSTVSNSNFQISSTLGQTIIGEGSSNNLILHVGFWKPVNILTPVENSINTLPKNYLLEQNYPNPFNPSTTISYQLPEISNVKLSIYDILGRQMKVLVNGEKPGGKYDINFNANNLPSGIYFYKLDAQSKVSAKHFTKVGKMILLK